MANLCKNQTQETLKRDLNDFIDRCIEWRVKQGLKQQDIAEMSGSTPSTVCRFEKNQRASVPLIIFYIRMGVTI